MSKRSNLSIVLSVLLSVYMMICTGLYIGQKYLVFPAYLTQPVPTDWRPKGIDSEQTKITGECGQLHVSLWRIANAKGTIMMFHGNGESLASINEYVDAFLELGYNLMAWDYPGYGQSTDCWFSQAMLLNDAETAYQWLATKEQPHRIYLFGYSIGTGIAVSVATRHQENPVYLVAAYDTLLNVAKDDMSKLFPIEWLLRYPMNTHQWLAEIDQTIYLIHGTQDTLIRPERAKSLVQSANGKAKIEWGNKAGHVDDRLFAYRNHWLKRLLPE